MDGLCSKWKQQEWMGGWMDGQMDRVIQNAMSVTFFGPFFRALQKKENI
jgi:hypothetical protein